MTPSPWMIRRTGRNRVDHQLSRASVANHRRRRLPRLQTRFTLFARRAANRSPTPGPPGAPPHGLLTTVWLGRSDCSRREARQWVNRFGSGPIGGGGDSPLTHRATWLSTRCSRSVGSISRRRPRSARAGRAVFPRRRTGAKSQPTPSSLRQGAPVSRRYAPVENALGVEAGGSLTPGSFDEPSVRVGVRSTRSPLSR